MFLRGRPELCFAIMLQKSRALIDIKNEPSFAEYDPMPNSVIALDKVNEANISTGNMICRGQHAIPEEFFVLPKPCFSSVDLYNVATALLQLGK